MTDSCVRSTDWEIRDDILLGEECISGCYSRVFEGEWRGLRVAVKTLRLNAMFVEVGLPKNNFIAFLSSFEPEWKAMKSLRHPNVLQLYGVCNPNAKQPKLVLELMNESLRDRLREEPILSSLKKIHVLKSIACGLKYLHELPCPVIHCYLTSKSIFLSQDAVEVKIGDLEVIKLFTKLCIGTGHNMVMPGTELYVPPEAYSEAQPHPSFDIFSFGVIMIETVTGQLPSPLPLLTQDVASTAKFRVLTELERRERDIQRIREDHPLRPVIMLSLDLPEQRPSTAQVLDTLSDYEEKMTYNENSSVFAELQACKQKVLELEVDKEMTDSQNRELTATVASLENKIEELISEVAILKTNNSQLSLQVVELTMSNVNSSSVDRPNARELISDTYRHAPVCTSSDSTQASAVATPNEVPTKLMHMVRSERVSIDDSLIIYSAMPEDGIGGLLSLDHKIDDTFAYFELQIITCGEHGKIGIGLAREDYPLNLQPGWDQGSVGYCCNDGRIFCGSRLGYPFSEPSLQGDILGCGIKRTSQSQLYQEEVTVFFTRNGVMMGQRIVMTPDKGFYPMVTLSSQGETIKANFSGQPCFGVAETFDPALHLESKLLMRYQHVTLDGDTVSYTANTRNDVGIYQLLSHPMDMSFSYFEVQLLGYDPRGAIGVGLAGIDHPLDQHPGYESGSIAFHCNNGKVWKESSESQHIHEPAKEGDIVGCGISRFTESTKLQAVVFFTINRALLGETTIQVPQSGLYPTIGLHSVYEMIRMNLNAMPLETNDHDQTQVVAIPLEFIVPASESSSVLLYSPPAYSALFPPVHSRYAGVRVLGCRVTYTGSLTNDVGVFQSLHQCIGNDLTYYQVQVVNYGFTGMISIGLAHNEYPLNRHPGWDRGSIAYHCDNGRLFYESNHGQCIHDVAQQGDRIGCGVSKVISSNPSRVVVFFTHNDMKLGEVTIPVQDGGLYPTVGLSSLGGVIDINFESIWNDGACSQSDNVRHECVYVDGDTVSYIGNQANDVGVFQMCGQCLSDSFPYFEVTVMNYGSKGSIAVGLADCNYPLTCQPGWKAGSVSYHCDNGELYMESEHGQSFYKPSRQGDVIGCGVLSFQESEQQAIVFFTHNNNKIGEVSFTVPPGGFFPTIGLHSSGEVVKIDVNVVWDDTDGSWSVAQTSDRYNNVYVQATDNTIRYTENWRNDVGVFQAITKQMTPRQPYFEVRIVEAGEQCAIGVGIARKSCPLNMQPGLFCGSIAYHCDDGKLFQDCGSSDQAFGTATKGDIIGCGVKFLSQHVVVFFTRNGMKLIETTASIPTGGFYPTVGLQSCGEVQINFDGQWIEIGTYHKQVQINGDRVIFSGKNQIGCFQALRKSMDWVGNYFEVEIMNCGTHGYIAIGLACLGYPLNRMPGWEPGSIAYHCDNGKLYEAKSGGRAFHSPSRSRDVIGCGVSRIIKLDPRMVEIFFTKNGVMMGQVTISTPTEGFFPTIGFYSEPGKVRVNLTAMGPVYHPISDFLSEGIQIQGNRLVYAGNRITRIGCYQLACQKLDSQFFYFEMTVVTVGANGASGIGVTHKQYPLNSMPGQEKDSVSFHGYSGQLFCGIGEGQPFHSPISEGDVIGCGLSLQNSQSRIFFTLNGTKIGAVSVNVPDEGFYPTIWMFSEGEAVDINFSVMWLKDHPSEQLQPPFKVHLERVRLDGDKISYVGDPQTSAGGVQVLSHPITPNFNQYKIQIINLGEKGTISIGLANRGYPLNYQPGWLPGSVAYHCYDKKLYTGSDKGVVYFSSKVGDVIGCSINFSRSDPHGKWVAVVFTCNGVAMGESRVELPLEQTYPTVGMHSEGEVIKLIM